MSSQETAVCERGVCCSVLSVVLLEPAWKSGNPGTTAAAESHLEIGVWRWWDELGRGQGAWKVRTLDPSPAWRRGEGPGGVASTPKHSAGLGCWTVRQYGSWVSQVSNTPTKQAKEHPSSLARVPRPRRVVATTDQHLPTPQPSPPASCICHLDQGATPQTSKKKTAYLT